MAFPYFADLVAVEICRRFGNSRHGHAWAIMGVREPLWSSMSKILRHSDKPVAWPPFAMLLVFLMPKCVEHLKSWTANSTGSTSQHRDAREINTEINAEINAVDVLRALAIWHSSCRFLQSSFAESLWTWDSEPGTVPYIITGSVHFSRHEMCKVRSRIRVVRPSHLRIFAS